MGCAESRPSINSTPQGLQKLKMENGYVKGRFLEARRSTGQRNFPKQRPSRKTSAGQSGSSNGSGSSGGRGGGGGGGHDGKSITRETQRNDDGGGGLSGGGGGAGKISFNLGEENELVDGWPKWLTDNIPRDVLAGIVPKSAESYDKLDKVGQGTYSNVYKARDKDTGKIVALKKVRFDTSKPESVKFMAREIMILQKLDHPNIVKLLGLATSRMQCGLYLVFDHMQTDLARIISRPDERLTEPQVKCYMHQLLSGLQHCHERGILHRDIKGSNLLIDKNGVLKIADFGLANYFDPNSRRHLTSRVVTLWYRAPELLLGATDYGVGIDLWSAGCLLAEMFQGRPILPGRTEVEQLHRIIKLCGTPSEDYWKRMKLSTTFRPPHAYKPSLVEAFRDCPESSVGLLNTLIALDPARRGSADSALQNKFFYTSPLACDLSGLPVIYKEEDEPVQNIQRRRQRNSKMRQRSRSQREPQKKDMVVEKPKADDSSSKEEAAEKSSELNSGQGCSAASNSSSMKRISTPQEGSPPAPPLPSSDISSSQWKKISADPQAHSNAANNTKNLPPLPNGKTRTVKYGDNTYRFNQIQRSVSTREFRKVDQRKLLTVQAIDG